MEDKNFNEMSTININNSDDNINNLPFNINNTVKREIDIDFEDERFDIKDENYHSKCGEIFVSKDKEFTFYCSICNENFLNFHFFSEHVLYDQNHENQLVFLNNCTNDKISTFITPSLPPSSITLANNPFKDYANCDSIVKTELTIDETDELSEDEESPPSAFVDDMLEVISAPPAEFYHNTEFNEQSSLSELTDEPIILANLREEIMQEEISNTSQGSNIYAGFHKCNFCKKDFSRAWNLNIHLKRCKFNVEKIEYHQAYKPDSAIKIMCPICKMSFQREVNLNFHLKKYHKNTVWAHTEESLLRCDLCNTSFKRREYLRKHIKRHMAKHRKQQILSNPIASDYKLECTSCNMKFEEEYQLFAHKTTHLYTETSDINEWDTKFSTNITSSTPNYGNSKNETTKIPFDFVCDSMFNQTNKTLKCENCDRSYDNEESLKMHNCINIFDRPHQCVTCNRSFMYQSYLKRHIKRCSMRNFINENYNKSEFKRFNDHESPIKYKNNFTDNSSLYIPSTGKTTEFPNTPTKSTICSPSKRKASGNLLLKLFKCKFCKKVFRSKINLQNHLSIHLKSQNKSITDNITTIKKIQLTPPSLKCKICGRRFKQKISLMMHERAHSDDKPYECNLCPLKFYNQGYLNFHQRSIHKIYTIGKSFNCEKCNKKFLTKSLLNIHINNIHEKEDIIAPFVLTDNSTNQYSEKLNSFEENISLPSSDQMNTLKNVSERTKYKCRFCPKLINRRTNLIIHERIHLGQRPHPCDICTKTFPSVSYVKLHKKNAHNITVPRIQYQCEYCPKVTTTEYFLTLHINNSHREQCPHECNNCLKRFPNIDDLNVHCKTEHSSLNNSDKIESKEMSAIGIGENENENIENIYECNVCSKSFNNLYKLNIHQREHNMLDKPYYCNLCDKNFSCAPYLWKHNQFWHKENTSNFTKILPNLNTENIFAEKEEDLTTTNVKLKNQKEDYYLYVHSCDICGKKFKKIAYLKMHVAKHTDTYKCEICGKRCSSSHNLNVHQQIHVNDNKVESLNSNTVDKTESTDVKIENSDNLSKAVNSCIKNKMSIIGASKFYNLDFRMLYKNVAIKRKELNEKFNVKPQDTLNVDDVEEKSPNVGVSQSNKFHINRKRIYKKRSSTALENSKFRQEGTKEREALIKAVRLYEAGELSQAQVAKSFNISVASLCRHMSTVPRSGETEVILSNDMSNSVVAINNEKSIKVPTDLSTWYTENSSNSENDDIEEVGEVIKAEQCFNNLNKSQNVDFKEIRKILSQPSKSLSTIKVDDLKFNEDINVDFQNLSNYKRPENDIEIIDFKLDNQQNSVRRHPIEKILKAVEEYKKGGVSQSKICETYKISLSTLKRHLKKSKRTIFPHSNTMSAMIQNTNEMNESIKVENSNNLIKAVNSCIKNKMSIIGASKFYNLDFKMLYKNVVIKRRELTEKANENNLLIDKENPVLNFEQKVIDNKFSGINSSSIFSNSQSTMKLLYNRNKKKFKKRVPIALGNSKFRQEGTAERAALIKAVRLYRSGEMSQVKAAKFCNISLATLCRHMNSIPKGEESKDIQLEERNNLSLNIEKDHNWSNTYNNSNYITENLDNIPNKVNDNNEGYYGNLNKTTNFNIDDILNRPSTYSTSTEYDKDDGQFNPFTTSHEFAEHSAFFSSDDQLSKIDKADLQRCSIEKISKAVEEYKKGGVSQSKICKMYRMSLSTLQRYLKDEQKPISSNYKPIPTSSTSSSTISTTNNTDKNFNDDNLLKAILAVRNDGLSHLDAANTHNVSVSALYLSLKRNEDNQ